MILLTNYNIHTYKDYWKNAQLVPSKSQEDKQLPILIDTLKRETDVNKIETVLEVGCGYGRIAKGLLESRIFPYLDSYTGTDLSKFAIAQAEENLQLYVRLKDGLNLYDGDFEILFPVSIHQPEMYDLVISVETLSVIPDPNTVNKWIGKMISLSKKYVVNLDFTRGNDTITNIPPHSYHLHYAHYSNSDFSLPKEIEISNNESIFVVRVR